MIALTQEQREKLANYARERLASHVIHGVCSDEEDILKIALASLTTVPKQWVVHTRTGDQFTTDANYVANAEGMHGLKATPLFAAPPVPEIKLPSIDEILSGYKYQASPHDARLFRFMISEIKRLNGLGE